MTTKKSKKQVAVAIVPKQSDSVEGLITQAIQEHLPVETMERFFALRKEVKAEQAKEAFISSMANFQAECPTIKKTKPVKNNSGKVVYSYAPIESIVAQVKDALKNNGFSYSTNMDMLEDGVHVTVKVQHILGHSESTDMTVPFGEQTNIMSRSQVVAAASTFAKRYAFLNAFGILTGDEDTDAAPVPQDTQINSGISVFERAKQMIDRATDIKVLNDYWKKIQGSPKYTPQQKEQIEGIIAARVQLITEQSTEVTIDA